MFNLQLFQLMLPAPPTQNKVNIVPSATTSKEDNWYGVDLNDLFDGHKPQLFSLLFLYETKIHIKNSTGSNLFKFGIIADNH